MDIISEFTAIVGVRIRGASTPRSNKSRWQQSRVDIREGHCHAHDINCGQCHIRCHHAPRAIARAPHHTHHLPRGPQHRHSHRCSVSLCTQTRLPSNATHPRVWHSMSACRVGPIIHTRATMPPASRELPGSRIPVATLLDWDLCRPAVLMHDCMVCMAMTYRGRFDQRDPCQPLS